MKIKEENASVVLLVTVIGFLMLIIVMFFIINMQDTKQNQDKRIDEITKEYEITDQEMEQVYEIKTNVIN